MAMNPNGLLDRLLHRRGLARWGRAARSAHRADLSVLRAQRQLARQLRVQLEELTHVADSRLALPRIGSNAFERPGGTLWSWRPQAWRGPLSRKGLAGVENKTKFGDEVTVFHDCKISELTLRQFRNSRAQDLAPFGLQVEVFQFDGNFLSLVLDLPPMASEGLKRNHLMRLSTVIDTEKPINVLARLNIKHGPNTEQLLHSLPLDHDDATIEFDLGYSQLNEKRVERVWIDLIFESPQMNQITIRDLTMCRYPRAEL